jgi:PPOX class probable F420-dependent enzyme
MSSSIPASHRDLLERPVCVVLSTIMPDGTSQLTPVWCDYDGNHIRIPTVPGRRKVKNMQERPNVSILAVDPENSYRYLEVRGVVDEITENGALEHLSAVTMAYMGTPSFYGAVAPKELEGKETRVIVKIRPTRVLTFGKAADRRDENPELDEYHR